MSVKNNYPKDNSNGWYGSCEVDFKELQKENEQLKETLAGDVEKIFEGQMENVRSISKRLHTQNEKLKLQLEVSIQANIEAELLEKAALRNAYEELKEENEKLKEHKLNREEQITKIADIVGYDYPNIDNNNKLIDMIENLKKQIPAKKGKKLSQNDKEILKGIQYIVEANYEDGSASLETFWAHEKNLLNRLLK